MRSRGERGVSEAAGEALKGRELGTPDTSRVFQGLSQFREDNEGNLPRN